MSFSVDYLQGCCGCPIRGFVAFALTHYFFYGIFTVIFVFTNDCYPPFYYVDYMFGISGATLIVVSCAGVFIANMKNCQFIRVIMGIIIIINVLVIVVSTFYYTIERWHDIMVTGIVKLIRPSSMQDFPDYLWNFLVVFACLNTPIMIAYLFCVVIFMFKKWKSYLFTQPYQNLFRPISLSMPTITVPSASTAYQPNK